MLCKFLVMVRGNLSGQESMHRGTVRETCWLTIALGCGPKPFLETRMLIYKYPGIVLLRARLGSGGSMRKKRRREPEKKS